MDEKGLKHFREQYGVDIDPLDTELTCYDFAAKHQASMRLWGSGKPRYVAVRVKDTDYLWRLEDGKYDGWDKAIS